LFIPNDGITEIVAHFIGYFEIRAEDCRYRPDFAEFSRQAQARPDEGDAHPRPLDFGNTLQLRTFVPEVAYVPAIQPIGPGSLTYSVAFDPISVPLPHGDAAVAPEPGPTGAAARMAMAQAEPVGPGSTIVLVSQIKYLMDDDIVVVGDHPFDTGFRLDVHAELDGLAARALDVSAGLADLTDLRSVTQMVGLVEDASTMARGVVQDDFGPLDSLFLKVSDRVDGHFSNGAEVDAAVTLEDALAALMGEDEGTQPDPAPPQAASLTIDASATPVTMTVSSGGNVSWNEAVIVNAGLPSAVIAVAGDYHRIDAIYQTNVLRDVDQIDEAWPAQNISIGSNIVQNSASLIGETYEARTGQAPGGDGGFPQNWDVTTIEGDMIFLSWVQQYNFTLDNDTLMLTATGTYSSISTGLNIGLDTMSFMGLGLYFDLIIIGGSLYDGNFISQTNVLLDSDRLMVEDATSASKGNAATGQNVLWNEAAIENIGPEWQQGLPGHYEEAATRLANGDRTMPDGFKSDGALDGFGNLKVLYVTGDVYDVHSVSQVNIVGDADDLTIYEDSLLKAQDSVWQVSTGHNLLVNKASILDYDGLGDTAYVGGEIYSDAILVQAGIVEGLTDRLDLRGDALANEVIAFLDDHTDLASRLDDHPAVKMMDEVGTTHDLLQSVLA
jgi:hypothetical protein